MASRPVAVRILHPAPAPDAGPLERWVSGARADLAEHHRIAFREAGADDARIVSRPPDDTPFGVRLREIIRTDRPAGLVVLGSGAIPLAESRDYRDLVAAAGLENRVALANNRFSADVVAVACADTLTDVPDLPGDNALPRWLAEVAGYRVADLGRRWRLGFDIDGPLELALLAMVGPDGAELGRVNARMAAVRAVAADRRAELIVTGRVSVRSLAWFERGIAARVRALVEERGLRARSRLAQGEADGSGVAGGRPRPPASVLGALLDRDGASALGERLAQLGEAAVVDTRVLLAHRLGPDEAGWPVAEDRFASDLLLHERIGDPWLRELTASAATAPIPILLGGHSLVGPGVRLLLERVRAGAPSWT
jgi:hypothetical protein